MTDYTYTVTSANFKIANTITINAGDTLKIIGGDGYGIFSSSDDCSNLGGNFPPEITKTTTYWKLILAKKTESSAWDMINPVVLRTAGTFSFKKGSFSSEGKFFRVTVEGSASSIIHANVNGTWKDTTPYVNVNGTWKEATPYVNVNGTWKESN